MKEKLKSLFLSDWSPAEKGLLIADVLLFGVLIGWITAPWKNGSGFFSNNSWNIQTNCADDCAEESKEEEN